MTSSHTGPILRTCPYSPWQSQLLSVVPAHGLGLS